MSDELDLYAKFTNPATGKTYEVDLDFAGDWGEARDEAAEALSIDLAEGDAHFVQINAYSSDGDLQTLADRFKWDDYFNKDEFEPVEDFLTLDKHDQIKTLCLFEYQGYGNIKDVIKNLDNVSVDIYGNEAELVREWLDMVDKDTVAYYVDDEKILDDLYRNRRKLPSGSIVAISE